MAAPRPLDAGDSLDNLAQQMQRRDRLRAKPAQKQAMADLHQMQVDRRISVADLQDVLRHEDDLTAAVKRLTGEPGAGDVAAQERRARWRKYVAGLAPDAPSAKWHDALIGAAKRQQLHERFAGVAEPPADWAG